MEKKLSKMRKDIETRLKRITGISACLCIFACAEITNIIPVQLANQNESDMVSGFQLGLLCTLLITYLARLVKYRKALKDDKLLKQLYYAEHDERMCFINQQVGKSTMSVTMITMVILTIIVGYFNFTAFITMVGVTILQGLIQLVLKWYYTNCVSCEDTDEE